MSLTNPHGVLHSTLAAFLMKSKLWNVVPRGCEAHLCYDCVMQIVFPGNRAMDASCPTCQRPVDAYSYAFFATHKHVSALQDTLSSLDAEVSGLKKSMMAASAEVEEAMARVDEWRRWATVAKGKLGSMPPSGMPRVHVVAPPESRSESARSRSPMPVVRAARIV